MVFIYSDIASVAKLLHSAISFLPIKENQIFDFFFKVSFGRDYRWEKLVLPSN